MSVDRMGNEQKRGYLPVFWQWVRHLYELEAVSDVQLCRDVGIDRKSLRKRRDDEGWQRRPYADETTGRIKVRYLHALSRALAFKTGEWASFSELEEAAQPHSISDFLNVRGIPHALAARHA